MGGGRPSDDDIVSDAPPRPKKVGGSEEKPTEAKREKEEEEGGTDFHLPPPLPGLKKRGSLLPLRLSACTHILNWWLVDRGGEEGGRLLTQWGEGGGSC